MANCNAEAADLRILLDNGYSSRRYKYKAKSCRVTISKKSRHRQQQQHNLFVLFLFIFLALVILLGLGLFLNAWTNFFNSGAGPGIDEDMKRKPRIVLWTKFYDNYDYSGTGVEPGLWDQCQSLSDWDWKPEPELGHEPCEIVYINRTEELREDDAIIFHLRNLEWSNLPSLRHPDQIWIFFSLESPEFAGMPSEHPGFPFPFHVPAPMPPQLPNVSFPIGLPSPVSKFQIPRTFVPMPIPATLHERVPLHKYVFNWTMTYRRDSDVPYPYGVITNRKSGPRSRKLSRLQQVVANKTRLAAVAITHCNTPSRRESYIRTLQHHGVTVDVYGRCSDNANGTCGSTDGINGCKSMACKFTQFGSCYSALALTHTFYLSFENSLCADYVTEKFFMALQHDIVPVVYGGLNAGYAELAPRYSYINARDFGSPKELAKYLRWLDMNPDEYLKYFEWKQDYEVSVSQAVGWCNLCRKLREWRAKGANERRRFSYEDIGDWWMNAPTPTPKNGNGAKTKASGSACERKPGYEYEGWENPKFNSQY